MNEFFQLLKELEVQAIESKIFVQLLDRNPNRLSRLQQEKELKNLVSIS